MVMHILKIYKDYEFVSGKKDFWLVSWWLLRVSQGWKYGAQREVTTYEQRGEEETCQSGRRKSQMKKRRKLALKEIVFQLFWFLTLCFVLFFLFFSDKLKHLSQFLPLSIHNLFICIDLSNSFHISSYPPIYLSLMICSHLQNSIHIYQLVYHTLYQWSCLSWLLVVFKARIWLLFQIRFLQESLHMNFAENLIQTG